VLSAVVARAGALKANASSPSPPPRKTEVVKGHYLNRMIKDDQLPMELAEGEETLVIYFALLPQKIPTS
jgi:hypothetical protein